MDVRSFVIEARETKWDNRKCVTFDYPQDKIILYTRNVLKAATTFNQAMTYLRQLHYRLGHASKAEMKVILKHAGASQWLLNLLDDVHCPSCDALAPPLRRRKVSSNMPQHFGEQLMLDMVFIDLEREAEEKKSITVLSIVDVATSYCRLYVVSDVSSAQASQCLEDWCRHYGAPKSTYADNAFSGMEWATTCSRWSIESRTSAAHAPWQHGKVERLHQVVRRCVQSLYMSTTLSSQEVVDMIACARNNIAKGPHGIAPITLVLGSVRPQPGDEDLLCEEYSGDLVCSQEQFDALKYRQLARLVYLEHEARMKIARAMHTQLSNQRRNWERGERVLIFRSNNSIHPSRGRWTGPCTIIAAESSAIYVNFGGRVFKVAPEHVRALTADEVAVTEDVNKMNEVQLEVDAGGYDLTEPEKKKPQQASSASMPQQASSASMPQQASSASMPQQVSSARSRSRPPVRGSSSTIPPIPSTPKPDLRIPSTPVMHPTDVPHTTEQSRQGEQSERDEVEQPLLKRLRAEREIPDLAGALENDEDEDVENLALLADVDEMKKCIAIETEFTRDSIHALVADLQNTNSKKVILHRLKNMSKTTHTTVVERDLNAEEKEQFVHAKQKEWSQWLSKNAASIASKHGIPTDRLLRTRWVLTWKLDPTNPGGRKAKARLVILGYQDPDLKHLRTDAPTASRSSKLMLSQLALQFGWRIFSLDATTAFLSGDPWNLEESEGYNITSKTRHKARKQQLYMEPPLDLKKGMGLTNEECLCLLKCAYGLADAPRSWWKKLTRVLLTVGFTQCTYDPCLFMLHKNEGQKRDLVGLIALHVDDMLCAGDGALWDQIMFELENKIQFGEREYESFTFTGVHFHQDLEMGTITLSQPEYAETISELHIPRGSGDEDEVAEASQSLIKQALGELQWLATQTRPDLSADTSLLSSAANKATITQVKRINKLVRRAQQREMTITLRKLSAPVHSLHWLVIQDAAFGIRDNGASQAGTLIYLTTESVAKAETATVSLMDWSSVKLERVVRSSFAAETQSAIYSLEMLESLQAKFEDILFSTTPEQFRKQGSALATSLVTDCKGLYTHLTTDSAAKANQSKGSVIDAIILKNLIVNAKCTLHWVNNNHMPADAMTKASYAGARMDLLQQVLATQRFQVSFCTVSGRREKAEEEETPQKLCYLELI
eukprot:6487025-Amphidinium_carterae.2